jgi:hypothetical protein
MAPPGTRDVPTDARLLLVVVPVDELAAVLVDAA